MQSLISPIHILFKYLPLPREIVWGIIRQVGDMRDYHRDIKMLYRDADRLRSVIHMNMHTYDEKNTYTVGMYTLVLNHMEQGFVIDIHMPHIPPPHNIIVMNFIYSDVKCRYTNVLYGGVFTTNMLIVST